MSNTTGTHAEFAGRRVLRRSKGAGSGLDRCQRGSGRHARCRVHGRRGSCHQPRSHKQLDGGSQSQPPRLVQAGRSGHPGIVAAAVNVCPV